MLPFTLSIVLLQASACSERGDRPAGSAGTPNVVWVVLDAAGARHLGNWGAKHPTSPWVDALAREGVSFDRAYAQWPSTLGSTSSFLTGRYPAPGSPPGPLEEPTIASFLQERGFRTVAFSENPFVSPALGFSEGFDEFHPVEPIRKESHPILDEARRDSARTVRRGLEWVDGSPEHPFFLYLHLLPPHAPYEPPPPFAGSFHDPGAYRGAFDGTVPLLLEAFLGKRGIGPDDLAHLRALYHENVAYADRQVGRLIEGLRSRGLLDRSILVVSSDHGEAFGEHEEILHGTTLYEEEIHVPLLIRFPGSLGPLPRRWDGVVELVDIVPTLLDALDLPPVRTSGVSLLRMLREEHPATGEARSWVTSKHGVINLAALTRSRFKLIVDRVSGKRELYDLEVDPRETGNLARRDPARADRLQRSLEMPVLSLGHGNAEAGPELQEQLRALGYVDD